jgi:hypothetical protein
MKPPVNFDVNESWRWLLQEIVLARNVFRLGATIGPAVNKPVLDLLLPSLLFVRATSMLDEALADYIDGKGYAVPKKYGTTLHGRLRFLNDQGKLAYSQELRDLKDRRNTIAHRSNVASTVQPTAVTWDELDWAVGVVEESLGRLNLIGPRPNFEFFWERDVDTYLDQPPPDKPTVRMTHHYRYGVREGEVRLVEFAQSFDFHRLGT